MSYQNLGFDSYYEYLQSKHWQWVREKYWQSGLPRQCRICNANRELVLHHRRYDTLGHEDIEADVICLCRHCHFRVHHYDNGTKVYLEYKYLKAWEDHLYARERAFLTRLGRFRLGSFINRLLG